MAQFFFSVVVYDYNSVGNQNWRNFPKSFNVFWCHFDEIATDDPKYADGRRAKITYYPGGAAQNAQEYFVDETIYELQQLVGKIASSPGPAA
jgi:hypothetical protein